MSNQSAMLVLADGTVMYGRSIGAEGTVFGECVFNTSMTGYQEIMTDPSYAQQMVVLTPSHVGNTGINREDMESSKIWAKGLIIKNCPNVYSNYRSELSLPEWLRNNQVVAIADMDCRQLTRHLRTHGAMNACLTTEFDTVDQVMEQLQQHPGLEGRDLAIEVSRQMIERWHEGRGEWAKESNAQCHHVVAYDFGVKHNILRILYDLGCHITLVPAQTPASEVLAMNPDGIFLSNGPGDPQACDYAIAHTKTFIDSGIPVFGICLGFQIIALACGAHSLKMKFGHHGANHPVVALHEGNRVFITSQNHGFAIDEESLPDCLSITHRSLFDQSLQGVAHKTAPVFGFQGHPEASPGPEDIAKLFTQFTAAMKERSVDGILAE